jgi:hypothetical protein
VRFAEFSQIFGKLNFSKHSCLVKDKPVQEWLAIVDAAIEAEQDNVAKQRNSQLQYLYD